MGRIIEAVDGSMQRLKNLEISSHDWLISQRIDLAPVKKPIISSPTEARKTIKEIKEENRTRAEASESKGKGDGCGNSWHDTS